MRFGPYSSHTLLAMQSFAKIYFAVNTLYLNYPVESYQWQKPNESKVSIVNPSRLQA
jgi:hypothetical protein